MANVQIEANYRSDMSKSRMKKIRRQGYVTGSIFGHNFKPVPVEVNLNDLVTKLKKFRDGSQVAYRC